MDRPSDTWATAMCPPRSTKTLQDCQRLSGSGFGDQLCPDPQHAMTCPVTQHATGDPGRPLCDSTS